MAHQPLPLFYFDENGYHRTSPIFNPGATSKPIPENIPAGKIAQWNGADWAIVDIPADAGTGTGGTGGGNTSSAFSPDGLPQALTYTAGGDLETITAGPNSLGETYKQTLTYTNGLLTNISAWIKQP